MLGREWRLSHAFKPTSYYNNRWGNSIHLSIGNHSGKHGDRVPVIFFKPNITKICTSLNEDFNFYKFFSFTPPVGEWTTILISQELINTSYMFKILINNKELYSVENNDPREFFNVKVYASNTWHQAQHGSIRNLKIETKIHGRQLNHRNI